MKYVISVLIITLLAANLFAQSPEVDGSANPSNLNFVTVQGFAIQPIGEFKENWDTGSGFSTGYGIRYHNHWTLIFQSGYSTYSANQKQDYDGDASFSLIPLMIGVRYYLYSDLFRPYLMSNNGINIVRRKYSRNGETVDKTTGHYHFQVGLGLEISPLHSLGIDISFKYNSHLLEPSVPYNITGLEYGFGLNWYLH